MRKRQITPLLLQFPTAPAWLSPLPFVMSSTETTMLLENVARWPFALVLTRLSLSIALGVFIGLEREHRQKAGVRTFTLTALLGCLGGLMGPLFAAVSIGFVAMNIAWMNHRQMVRQQKLVLTTSLALAITVLVGILFGEGHMFTPAVAGILTAALLAWKQPISRFVVVLSDQELRSAILLAILTFIVLPVLPSEPIDPWGLIEPKSNWASVIVIAGIGFINYVFMRILGARGMEITAFFGGLVNSRKVIVELATRLKQAGPALLPTVHRGILLTTGAMMLRNVLIVAVLASEAVIRCAIPLTLMMMLSVILWHRVRVDEPTDPSNTPLALESPFKLSTALSFGAVFLALNVIGALAQREFGSNSFYAVSVLGGLLSGGSAIASAANLIVRHEIPLTTGATGIVLSTLTSVLINVPLVRSLSSDPVFNRKIRRALTGIVGAGLAGVAISIVI